MNKHSALNKMIVVLGSLVLAMTAYFRWLRPYQLRWGATGEEVKQQVL